MKILGFITNLFLATATFLQSTSLLAHDDRTQPADAVSPAVANIKNLVLKSSDPETGMHFQVDAFETENDDQTRDLVNEMKQKIKVALRDHPDAAFEVNVRMGDSGSQDITSVQLDEEAHFFAHEIGRIDKRIKVSETNQAVDPSFKAQWKRWRQKNYRMGFALLRGGISGGFTTFSLFVTAQMPLGVLAAMGHVTGAMSFGIQYYSKAFYGWATNVGWLADQLRIPRGPVGEDGIETPSTARLWTNRVDEGSRWYSTEIAYMLIFNSAMAAFGYPTNSDSGELLKTAFFAYLAQGSWDLAITHDGNRAERLRFLTPNQNRFRTNAKYVGAAAVAIVLMMAKFVNVPNLEIGHYADLGYYMMTATGVAFYLRSLHNNKKMRPLEADAPTRIKAVKCDIILRRLPTGTGRLPQAA